MNEQDKLELSAFFDDEAADTQRLGAVLKTAEGRDAWARQCLVRDALRGDSLAASQGGVADRVRAALEDEPVIFNPAARSERRPTGANVSRKRQFAGLALAATVAGVAFLGLTQVDPTAPNRVAENQAPASTTEFPPINGVAGAVVADDVRPVTRLVTDEQDAVEAAVNTDSTLRKEP